MADRHPLLVILILNVFCISCQSVEHVEKRIDPPLNSKNTQQGQHQSQQPVVGGSLGCKRENKDTGLMNVSIKVGSTPRTFIRVVNKNYNHKSKHILVIGYHGLGLDGNSPRVDHKWAIIEDLAGDTAIFIYGNALGGQWNGGSDSSDVIFFDELVKSVGDLYCIDQKRIFVHGFSNGAFFVNDLVAQRKDAIRGVISVAGGGSGTRIPAMIIHGIQDPNVGYDSYAPSTVNAYAAANGCKMPTNAESMKLDSCQLLEGCPKDLPVKFCRWNGNHHWPEFTLPDVWNFISSLN